MNQDLKKHIMIRIIIGMLTIGLLAYLIFSPDKHGGNNGIGINVIMFIALITLIVFGIVLLIEAFNFFACGEIKIALSNIGVIFCIGSFYIIELYLNHLIN